jgi:23S rRNA pseudouridine1911/1915/1917 synthase
VSGPQILLRGRPGRLDAVLAQGLSSTRAEAQRAIDEGRVLVDGVGRPRSFRLTGGEEIRVETAGADGLEPQGPPVPVRFEDSHLLVVAKPAGLVTHPTQRRRTGTLVNRLLGMGITLSSSAGPLRPGIVHRLDAGTSGLMLVAKDDVTHAALADMLRRHEVERRYLALVRGSPTGDRFAVDAPLGRTGARVRIAAAAGRQAETLFEVRERLPRSTLLVAAPQTGRTHQIRVHLSAIGHPILGDRVYGGGGSEARDLALMRPFLHSWRIAFRHPVTGERVEIEEPLPAELEDALERARGGGKVRPDGQP